MLPIYRRQDLHDFVSEVMAHTYERLLRGERFDVGQAMLKSYLVETHPKATGPLETREDRQRFLAGGIEPFFGQVGETEDARLFLFDIPQADADDPLSFIVDMEDDRYWVLHTASPTVLVDRAVERLTSDRPFFDSAWLPGRFLTSFTHLGRLFKVSVRFNDQQLQTPVPPGRHQFGIGFGEDREPGYFPAAREAEELAAPRREEEEIGQSVSLTLRDHLQLRDGLQELDETRYLRNAINVTRAEVRYAWNGDADEFSNARIYSWGKITGSGSSSGAHLDLLRRLRTSYRSRIEGIEDRLSLRTQQGRLTGQPVNIIYRPVVHFEPFVFNLFSGSRPFRLDGIPQFRRSDFATVAALDLHSRQPLRFEITPTYMTIALRGGSCGNSIARLFTNVLQHLDAGARIFGGSEDAQLFD